MDGFVIRDAVASDREQIGLLWLYLMQFHNSRDPRFQVPADGCDHYEKRAIELMRSRDGRVIVAQDVATSEVVAYILGELQVRSHPGSPEVCGLITDMFVVEEWRRGGIGHALFDEMKRWFISRSASAIELYVADANVDAVQFWRELGMDTYLHLMHMKL